MGGREAANAEELERLARIYGWRIPRSAKGRGYVLSELRKVHKELGWDEGERARRARRARAIERKRERSMSIKALLAAILIVGGLVVALNAFQNDCSVISQGVESTHGLSTHTCK